MNNKWWQIWVRHSQGKVDPITAMTLCEPILMRFNSMPIAPRGVPIVDDEGFIEVRSYTQAAATFARKYLEEQGFVVVKGKENQ